MSVTVITGASSGIGSALAPLLAAEGHAVALLASFKRFALKAPVDVMLRTTLKRRALLCPGVPSAVVPVPNIRGFFSQNESLGSDIRPTFLARELANQKLARARHEQSVAGAGQRHEKGEGEEEGGAERTAVAGAPRRPACTWRGSSPPP